MRKRFQFGHLFKRGERRQVWIGRWREPIVREGKLLKVNRAQVLGAVSDLSKSEARKALEARVRPLNDGFRRPVESFNFARFAERWREVLLPAYRESTRTFYKGTIARWIVPYFGARPLAEITTPDVQLFLNSLAQNYSRSVLKHVRASLSVMLRAAVEWGYLTHNPALGARLPQGTPVKRARLLSPAEIRQVIANLEQPYRAMAVMAATLGVRESEGLALQWEDVDADRRTIRIGRSVYRGKVGEPKTKLSAREIPIGPGILETLEELAETSHRHQGFLFLREDGKLFDPCGLARHIFKPLAHRLGLPEFTWRSFRRSAATAMHNAGVPLKVQQKILGHTDADMSLLYTESETKEERRAVDGLDELMVPKWFPSFQPSGGLTN